MHTVEGVRGVSPEARDTAAMLHVGPVERLYRVYLPAALPSIAAGLRVALSIGLVLVVDLRVHRGSRRPRLLHPPSSSATSTCRGCTAGIVFLGLLGYVLNRLFLLVERHLLAWHHGAVGAVER